MIRIAFALVSRLIRWGLLVAIVVSMTPWAGRVLSLPQGLRGIVSTWEGEHVSHRSNYKFHRTDDTGRPYRWWPCNPIRWRFNIADESVLRVVRNVLADTEATSGLTFTEQGPTNFTPTGEHPNDGEAMIDIAYTPHANVNGTATGVHAETFVTEVTFVNEPLISAAGIVITGQPESARQLRFTVLRAVGQAVGLDIVSDDTQAMASNPSTGQPGVWGAGDREGLALLGSKPSNGCPL